MFCYETPQFKKKRLLRAEMLEQLRDYPRDYLEIMYAGYSDGVLCGCGLVWNEDRITVEPGMILHKNKLYFMKDPLHLECPAEDRIRYVKVQFLTLVYENERTIGNTRVYLDDKLPDPSCELELCRFRLQAGARLRNTYENFSDCVTEFDTIHLVEVPWASPVMPTLHPAVLRQYAMEILRKNSGDGMDTGFAMNVLANDGVMPAEALRFYIENRLGDRMPEGNQALYDGLKKILQMGADRCSDRQPGDGTRRQVMLI